MSHHLEGIVQSGTGRGAKFIALPIYSNIFEKYLGKTPFHGTLNLELDEASAKIVNHAFTEGKVYENLEYDGKSYGGIVIINITISLNGDSIKAVAVRPHLTSHDSNIVELVSDIHLRKRLHLDDGSSVQFSVN